MFFGDHGFCVFFQMHDENTLKSEFPTDWQCWPEVNNENMKHTLSISLFLMAIFHFNVSLERKTKRENLEMNMWQAVLTLRRAATNEFTYGKRIVWERPHSRGHEAKSGSERCCWSNDKIFNVSWDGGGVPQSGSLMENTENVYEQEDALKNSI